MNAPAKAQQRAVPPSPEALRAQLDRESAERELALWRKFRAES